MIDARATGTEIVMGLRWVLARLLEDDDAVPADLRTEARRLHRALDNLLSETGPFVCAGLEST
jgi:hypothetical protein